MPWDYVLANWATLVDPLCGDFPHLDPDAVRRFRGDRLKLEVYLAETHDLTRTEAGDVLDDWLTFTGRNIRPLVAA